MNLCLISDEFLKENPTGGIGTYTNQLFMALTGAGHSVTVITFGRYEKSKTKGNASLFVIKRYPIPFLSVIVDPFLVFLYTLKLNRQKRFDAIEAPEWHALSFFLVLFNRLTGVLPPIVVRLHCPLVISRLYNREKLSNFDKVRNWMERFTAKNSTAINCPSNALAVWAKKQWNLKRKIAVIPNFIDNKYLGITSAEKKEKIVLFMGNLAYIKGFDVFLKALPFLEEESDVQFHIMGRKSSNPAINLMLDKSLANSRNVHYLGFLEGESKFREIQESSVIVLPSLWETFPMACIESMAASKIIIASIVGGFPEIIINGKNGFLVPPGEPKILASVIKQVLNMDQTRKELIQENARLTVEKNFSAKIVAKKIIAFYQTL